MIPTVRRLAATEVLRVLLVAVGLSLFMGMLVVVYEQVGAAVFKGTEDLASIARAFDIRAFAGPDRVFANLVGVGLTHPLFVALMATVVVGLGARSCAGELQDGTLELTLARPISRRSYLAAYMVFTDLAAALLLLVVALVVPAAATLVDASGRIDSGPMAQTAAQAWLLYSALGALATLLSTLAPSRTAATTWAIAMLVGAYLLEFFARLWAALEPAGWLSPFHYFTPTDTLIGSGIAWRDVAMLAAIALGANLAASAWFERRDLA